MDSLWVLGGIHGASLGGDLQAAARAATDMGLMPRWVIPQLVW
jgi:hypothetical protein